MQAKSCKRTGLEIAIQHLSWHNRDMKLIMNDNSEAQTSKHSSQFFDRPVPNMVARVMVVLIGMALVAFGIALSRQTLLGSSPISAIPTVLSFAFPYSIGTFTFAISIVFLAAQALLLRRNFSPVQLLQLPFLIIFSITIDFFVAVVTPWPFDTYPICLMWMLLSCVAVAGGVYLQTQVRLIMLPGDAVVLAISNVSGWKFSNCKLGFDISQMVIAVAISLACSGALIGVREGTVIAALLVGPIISVISRMVRDFQRFIPVDGHPSFLPAAAEAQNEESAEADSEYEYVPDISLSAD